MYEGYPDYLFKKLAEEAAEVIQDTIKLQTFGNDSCNPMTGVANEDKLINEIHDFIAAVEMLRENGLLNFQYDRSKILAKKRKVINKAIDIGLLTGVKTIEEDDVTFSLKQVFRGIGDTNV